MMATELMVRGASFVIEATSARLAGGTGARANVCRPIDRRLPTRLEAKYEQRSPVDGGVSGPDYRGVPRVVGAPLHTRDAGTPAARAIGDVGQAACGNRLVAAPGRGRPPRDSRSVQVARLVRNQQHPMDRLATASEIRA